MTLELFLFLILAVVSIAAAVGMLQSKNAVYAALFLVITMGALAILYLLLEAPFIAMAQVTVYAGAIMVLFLFVIMLLGAEQGVEQESMAWQKPLAYVLGALLLLEAGYIFLFRSGAIGTAAEVALDFGSPEHIGTVLYSQYLMPFEVTSVVLLVAIVGAIVLSRRT